MDSDQLPDDFPRDPWPAAVGGAHTKFSARLIDGKYVVGLTEDERRERYEICIDLVEQLVAYCRRKRAESSSEPFDVFFSHLERRVRNQGWDVSPTEIAWLLSRVRAQL